MIDSGQAQVIANAINSLANLLAKPQQANWRQSQDLHLISEILASIAKELVIDYP